MAPSDGSERLAALAEGARTAGLATVGVVAETTEEFGRLAKWAHGRTHPTVLVGWESPVGAPVPELPGAPAFRIGSAKGIDPPTAETAKAGRPVGWVGHFGSDPETSAGPERLSGWVRWAVAAKVPLELTPSPGFDGLDAVSARPARRGRGVGGRLGARGRPGTDAGARGRDCPEGVDHEGERPQRGGVAAAAPADRLTSAGVARPPETAAPFARA